MLLLLGVTMVTSKAIAQKSFRTKSFSPLLLFRDKRNGKVIIAHGYHRLCAVYTFDESAMILCKIAGPD